MLAPVTPLRPVIRQTPVKPRWRSPRSWDA